MKLLTSILDAMKSGSFNILIYLVIIFVFLVGVFKCVLPVTRARNRLRKAVRDIRMGADAKVSWQDDYFLGKGTLGEHWNEYLNNLFFADGVYHNASNVEDYINEETVIYGPGRASFSDAVPGLLTSIGFLGTLIGLAQGLSGFSMNDSEAVMGSIITLIPGMRTAFMTSIFGVVGSVGFTLITRAVHGSTQHTLNSFYSAMSRFAGVQSVDPMTQIAIYQQDQTAMIRKLTEGLETNLADAIQDAIQPLQESLDSYVQVTSKEQMRFLDAVVTRFIERMDSTLSGQLRNLSKSMAEASGAQTEAAQSFRKLLTETSAMLDGVREAARNTEQMAREGGAFLESVKFAQTRFKTVLDQMNSAAEKSEAVMKQQEELISSFAQLREELSGATGAVSGDMEAAAEKLARAQTDFTEKVGQELTATLDGYKDYVNAFQKRIDEVYNSISRSLEELPESVKGTAGELLRQTQLLSDSVREAAERIGR